MDLAMWNEARDWIFEWGSWCWQATCCKYWVTVLEGESVAHRPQRTAIRGERAQMLECFSSGFEFCFYLLLTLVGISMSFRFRTLVFLFKTRAVELYQWFSTFTGLHNHLGKFLNNPDTWALCPEILIHLVWSGTKSSIFLKKSPHVTPVCGQSGERTPELDDFSGSFGSQVQQYSPAPAAFAARRKF